MGILLACSSFCSAETHNNFFRHPFYLGGIGGFGSTTWKGLVPKSQNQEAVDLSTPIHVSEGGGTVGAFGGYEISKSFAIEVSYMHYPNASVAFDPEKSLFSFDHNGQVSFKTQTESISVMGKVMLLIPNTNTRFFSSLGGANVHRRDILTDYWRISPTFGTGLNFRFSEKIMGEFGANYTAGFGESNINPTESYFPFLYSVTMRVAYCF